MIWKKIPRAIIMLFAGLIVGDNVYGSFIDDGKCWRLTKDESIYPFCTDCRLKEIKG